ncbi:MAG: TIGR04282 family arsenosugar biosynthesis glycosyltransferase [Gaiella sp.]
MSTELPGRGARALVVAKAPLPGRVKTRLVPALGAERAARLARAMLLDTIDGCRAEVAEVGVLHASPDEHEALATLLGDDRLVVRQDGAGLEAALLSGMRRTLDERETALLVSSDVPGIPPGSLRRAVAALDAGADVVLGPGDDGGYWLVAMREPHAAPFARIPWSTPDVLSTTLERCKAAHLDVALIDRWRDVDTPDDLVALAGAARLPGRRTEQFIAQHVARRAESDQDARPRASTRPRTEGELP